MFQLWICILFSLLVFVVALKRAGWVFWVEGGWLLNRRIRRGYVPVS